MHHHQCLNQNHTLRPVLQISICTNLFVRGCWHKERDACSFCPLSFPEDFLSLLQITSNCSHVSSLAMLKCRKLLFYCCASAHSQEIVHEFHLYTCPWWCFFPGRRDAHLNVTYSEREVLSQQSTKHDDEHDSCIRFACHQVLREYVGGGILFFLGIKKHQKRTKKVNLRSSC